MSESDSKFIWHDLANIATPIWDSTSPPPKYVSIEHRLDRIIELLEKIANDKIP